MRLWKSQKRNIFTTLNMKNKKSLQSRSENALVMPISHNLYLWYLRYFYLFWGIRQSLNINMNFENLSDPMGFELFPLLKFP